ncbi:20660_t:CDS:2 [Entrophospora sp. SA101]|nr:20660_t:CDS:2 [Entrophospora sp. SA101]
MKISTTAKVPLLGGDLNLPSGKKISDILLPIYKDANENDLIKIGVLDLDNPRYKDPSYNELLIYKRTLDDLVSSKKIGKQIFQRIDEIKKIEGFEEAQKNLKLWYKDDDLFSTDFDPMIMTFLRRLVEKILCYFNLNSSYWELNHSETHKHSGLFFDIFCDLFYNISYSIEGHKGLRANKERRNLLKTIDENVEKALVPDITIEDLRNNLEVLIVEHGKQQLNDNRRKFFNDKFKSCILLHDMLRSVYNELRFVNEEIKTFDFSVFSVVTSGLEMKIFSLSLVAPELYVLQKISQYSLPRTIHSFSSLSKNAYELIKFRVSAF